MFSANLHTIEIHPKPLRMVSAKQCGSFLDAPQHPPKFSRHLMVRFPSRRGRFFCLNLPDEAGGKFG